MQHVLNICMKAGFGLVNKKKINKTKTNLPNPAWKTPAYIISVSYTHLDVYKRQHTHTPCPSFRCPFVFNFRSILPFKQFYLVPSLPPVVADPMSSNPLDSFLLWGCAVAKILSYGHKRKLLSELRQ